jgi:dipeptide/tripeptide permease
VIRRDHAFLLFLVLDGSVAMLVLVLLVFVVGEMLWVPTSQAIVARLAPEERRSRWSPPRSAWRPSAARRGGA